MSNIKVGQTMRFDPYREMRGYGIEVCQGMTTGKVTFVHPEHRWFMVEHRVGNEMRKVGYSFNDLYGEKKKIWRVET